MTVNGVTRCSAGRCADISSGTSGNLVPDVRSSGGRTADDRPITFLVRPTLQEDAGALQRDVVPVDVHGGKRHPQVSGIVQMS